MGSLLDLTAELFKWWYPPGESPEEFLLVGAVGLCNRYSGASQTCPKSRIAVSTIVFRRENTDRSV